MKKIVFQWCCVKKKWDRGLFRSLYFVSLSCWIKYTSRFDIGESSISLLVCSFVSFGKIMIIFFVLVNCILGPCCAATLPENCQFLLRIPTAESTIKQRTFSLAGFLITVLCLQHPPQSDKEGVSGSGIDLSLQTLKNIFSFKTDLIFNLFLWQNCHATVHHRSALKKQLAAWTWNGPLAIHLAEDYLCASPITAKTDPASLDPTDAITPEVQDPFGSFLKGLSPTWEFCQRDWGSSTPLLLTPLCCGSCTCCAFDKSWVT